MDTSVCSYCFSSLNDLNRTIDHLTPESRGGIKSNKNKRPCCFDCNQLKGDMTVQEFSIAIEAMIRLENTNYRKKIGYLKKISKNSKEIISTLKNKKK